MLSQSGQIDVKYEHFSYHAHIGLGKWTHEPTLETSLNHPVL